MHRSGLTQSIIPKIFDEWKTLNSNVIFKQSVNAKHIIQFLSRLKILDYFKLHPLNICAPTPLIPRPVILLAGSLMAA